MLTSGAASPTLPRECAAYSLAEAIPLLSIPTISLSFAIDSGFTTTAPSSCTAALIAAQANSFGRPTRWLFVPTNCLSRNARRAKVRANFAAGTAKPVLPTGNSVVATMGSLNRTAKSVSAQAILFTLPT